VAYNKQNGTNIMTFENKILRVICGPVYNDDDLRCWCRRINKETRELTGISRITNFVKAQKIKWFGHVMRRSNSEYLKAAVK